MGTSYGKWEGNTLVVTTLAQNGESWLDRTGDYLTNSATVTERFSLKDHDHMNYTATVDDPSVYGKPWTIHMTLYRRVEPNAQILRIQVRAVRRNAPLRRPLRHDGREGARAPRPRQAINSNVN